MFFTYKIFLFKNNVKKDVPRWMYLLIIDNILIRQQIQNTNVLILIELGVQ